MTDMRDEALPERLAWHKPEILRLTVSLDTRDSGGSTGDGEFGTVFDLQSP